ncbi:hypothetical protein K435DRAFT_858562 [Dendrothele bispora CBS 962.96]|uniref:Uncharacterized protein n=1 Tax=Dendrothele bispora (strain CBS 962.96) TaxID=1314807 RepID=A0A4S8M2U3_DENBC|nr:hypothetical protein K435DRAFT_858562 [Dendrothele bispora CBS 962.96]
MTGSPFTPAQLQTLKDDFLPGYLTLDSDKARNRHLTTIIDQILEHKNFRGKLGSEKTEKAWKECIAKYFKNQCQQQIRQEVAVSSTTRTIAHDPVNCVKGMRTAVKLFQVLGNENIDGQTFFKTQNKERIREHAASMNGNPTANFKKALKELWDAEADKASYESQAREYWNVPNNQFQFLLGASRLLSALCEYKHLGKVELMLMYTWGREDGTFDSGCVSGHSDPNTSDFSDEHEEVYKRFLEVWGQYGEKYCQTPDSSSKQRRLEIPVDSTGRPRFPELDLEKVTGEELREVMAVYFKALWGFAGRKGQPAYDDVKGTQGVFFDSGVHKLPCFGNPHDKEFTRSMVTQLAEWLCTHSSMSATQPFEFLSEMTKDPQIENNVPRNEKDDPQIEKNNPRDERNDPQIEKNDTTRQNLGGGYIEREEVLMGDDGGAKEDRVETPTDEAGRVEVQMGSKVPVDERSYTEVEKNEGCGSEGQMVEVHGVGVQEDGIRPETDETVEEEADGTGVDNGVNSLVEGTAVSRKAGKKGKKKQPAQHGSAGTTLRRSDRRNGATEKVDSNPPRPGKRTNPSEESNQGRPKRLKKAVTRSA